MKYTGKLNKPIARERLGLLASEEQLKAALQREANEIFEKLPLLAQAHNVKFGDWLGLTIALAREHVPGFKVVNPPGRPTEWGVTDKAAFRLDVDAVRQTSGLSLEESIKVVCRQDQWKSKTKKPSLDALRQHYYHADGRWIDVVQKSRSFNALKVSNPELFDLGE